MASDEIERLRARIAELEQQLRELTVEQNAPPEPAPRDEDVCPACGGDGDFWVHDFQVDCKRCGGTGRVAKQ